MTIPPRFPIEVETQTSVRSGYTRNPSPPSLCCVSHVLDLPRDLSLAATAFHESGHGLLALLGGMNLSTVFVSAAPSAQRCPGPEMYETAGANRDTDYGGRELGLVLPMLAAGERTAQEWLRQNGLWTERRAWAAEVGSLDDQATAAYVLGANGIPMLYGTGALLADYWHAGDLAAETVRHHWNRIERMASGLLSQGQLTGDEIAALDGLENPARSAAQDTELPTCPPPCA
ncbi:hypothetical protein GCM10010519_31780 [Streptomyces lactacystinicus]